MEGSTPVFDPFLPALRHSTNNSFKVSFISLAKLLNQTWKEIHVFKNLFISSDAIFNRDALWSTQCKKHYLQAVIVGGIHHTGKILR